MKKKGKVKRYLKKIKTRFLGDPLPTYDTITVDEIPRASILLYYNGNKLTETIGNFVYKYRYVMPPFHTALYIGGPENQVINVGMFVELVNLQNQLASSRRVDVIVFPELMYQERELVIRQGRKDIGKFYDVKGFLGFGRDIPIIGPLINKLRPSAKLPFCSDHVVDSFNALPMKVSEFGSEQTAPWDIANYCEDNKVGEFRTVHIGKKFKT